MGSKGDLTNNQSHWYIIDFMGYDKTKVPFVWWECECGKGH